MTGNRRFAIPGSGIALAFLLATTVPPAALAAPLVGYWPMEENGGATIFDQSGEGNDGALTGGPTWVTGQRGAFALNLNGSQYATVPDDASLDITSQITLATWIKPAFADTQDLINKKVLGSTDGYELTLSSPVAVNVQKVFVRFNQATSGDTLRVNSTTMYPADGTTWIHAAATYDGATIRLYVNGVQEASLAAVFSIATNALPLRIGAQPSTGDRTYEGAMDEVRVYNVALSAAQILELKDCGGATAGAPCASDSDACTLDQCDGLGSCVHTPICPTPTSTATVTATPTATATATSTATVTSTPTDTSTSVSTQTATHTPPSTLTATPTVTPTATGGLEFVTCGTTPIPMTSCRQPIVPQAFLFLKTKSPDSRDKLVFRWKKGAMTDASDFGTPPSTTKYSLCAYDQDGLIVDMQVPAGGTCSGGPCWRQTGSGFRYSDAALTNDGAQRLILKAGVDGKAKILVGAKGPNLGLPAMLSVAPPVTVQVKNSNGVCWGAVFTTSIRNTSELFKGKGG